MKEHPFNFVNCYNKGHKRKRISAYYDGDDAATFGPIVVVVAVLLLVLLQPGCASVVAAADVVVVFVFERGKLNDVVALRIFSLSLFRLETLTIEQ